jgi:hypothetical protein
MSSLQRIDPSTVLSVSKGWVSDYIGKQAVIRKQLEPHARQVWDDVDYALESYHLNNQSDQRRSRVLELALRSVVLNQADLLWRYKGTPENQTKEQQVNDYYNAKRYVGFIIAHRIFESCAASRCLFTLMPQPCIEYLQAITLEEFVRYKAYHLYLERIESDEPAGGNEYSDYHNAMGFLDQVANKTCAQENQPDKECLVKIFKQAKHFDSLDLIERAKQNTLVRLGSTSHFNSIKGYIDNVYGVIRMIEHGDSISPDTISKAIHDLYAIASITNVLEFALKCYLLPFLSPATHNDIRNKYGKDPI